MPDLLRDHDWLDGTAPRVLVEAAEWPVRATIEGVLRGAGYRTLSCAGPEGTGHRCALAAGEGCPAAEVADVVVHALRPSDARNLEALRALRRRRPTTPVIVEVPAAVIQDRAADLAGCTVLPTPVRQGDLLDAVRQAVAPRA